MSTITEVEVSRDLRYAKLFVSVYGSEEEQSQTLEGLQSAGGFIRIGTREKNPVEASSPNSLSVSTSPFERGVRLTNIIRQVVDDKRDRRLKPGRLCQERNESIAFQNSRQLCHHHPHPSGR